ncbi:metallophosphoesterase [Achromobacter sp. GG226]|uniref:metallophosphoesterase n=1 Tax=Verticiella alkaliphila TaxID=2779529 RepID=UPI001C0C9E79|nr:metallophosphoesterase [Verticiella sp. GG226]MBU4613070.1 metallophosphoesterase [Verticiella sp. GG226]
MYDIIGDIHGHASALTRLLTKLGYQETAGVWQHPQRRVIFLGDFVDRGPAQRETVRIARTMVEAGHALTVMGNHEFNAVTWASPDPERPGSFLRPHSDKNRRQHQAFLDQVGEGSAAHREMIEWFKTLPLYLDLDGVRIVHACWHPAALRVLQAYTDDQHRIAPDAWPELCRKGSPAYEALETVLKGLEIPLPTGSDFHDKDGNPRRHIRTQWWNLEGLTYRDLAMVPADVIPRIPHEPVAADVLPGYDGKKPLFIGHYWMSGDPTPLNPFIACVDYSIAAQHVGGAPGKLCAYRFDGEAELAADKFVWVE